MKSFIYILFYFLIFMLGGSLGSFSNVVIDRQVRHVKMTLKDRSKCDACNHVLGILDLFPVFSYLILGGKCRYCKTKYGKSHVITEILFGIIFILLYLYTGFTLQTIINWILFTFCYIIFMVDYKIQEIPFVCDVGIFILAIISFIFIKNINWISALSGMFSISLLLFIISLIKPGAFGGGDIELFLVSGALLGFKNIVIAFVLSLIFCTIEIIVQSIKENRQIAFGPAITLGIMVAQLFGNIIFSQYIGLFNL